MPYPFDDNTDETSMYQPGALEPGPSPSMYAALQGQGASLGDIVGIGSLASRPMPDLPGPGQVNGAPGHQPSQFGQHLKGALGMFLLSLSRGLQAGGGLQGAGVAMGTPAWLQEHQEGLRREREKQDVENAWKQAQSEELTQRGKYYQRQSEMLGIPKVENTIPGEQIDPAFKGMKIPLTTVDSFSRIAIERMKLANPEDLKTISGSLNGKSQMAFQKGSRFFLPGTMQDITSSFQPAAAIDKEDKLGNSPLAMILTTEAQSRYGMPGSEFMEKHPEEARKIIGDYIAQYQDSITSRSGTFLPMVDEQGRVIGAWNAKTNTTVNVPEQFAGARKSALTLQERKDRTSARSGLRAISEVEKMLTDPSILVNAALPKSPGARKFQAAIKEMTDVLVRLRTGAALNDQEEEFYKSQAPTLADLTDKDSKDTINYKLDIFRQLFNDLAFGGEDTSVDMPGKGASPKREQWIKGPNGKPMLKK